MRAKGFIPLLMCLLLTATALAQKPKTAQMEVRISEELLDMEFSTDWDGDISMSDTWFTPSVEGMCSNCGQPGMPALPTLSRIVALPAGSTLTLEDWSGKETTEYDLSPLGKPLRPVRDAWVKDAPEPEALPNKEIYSRNAWFRGGEPVEVENLGVMKDEQIFRITINPFSYQTATHHLKAYSTLAASFDLRTAVNATQSSRPAKYLIVSRPKFRSTLQPFVQWKRMQGFDVEELYANSHKRDTVKALIGTVERPDYILLVGDAGEIQSFIGEVTVLDLGSHITDMPYAEFTGDKLPDAFLGRWTVNDTAELRAVMEKTMRYEQFRGIDTNQLKRTLLVAGRESTVPAPTTTNGQVNYLKEEIKYAHPEMDTLCYYNPASDYQMADIAHNINLGASLLNYTAHCTVGGWSHPAMTIGTLDTLDNPQPLFYVNNCCKSNDFGGTCFGEQLLRKPSGGAVAVIGATNSTLWEEDFWWAVGPTTISLTPSYDPIRLGAFDRLAGRAPSITSCGEMLMAGNLAVSSIGSNYAPFYWEIYCLLGDPSLQPYIGNLQPIDLIAVDIVNGATTLSLTGTPGVVVTALQDTILLGRAQLSNDGTATMHLCQSLDTLPLLLTATASGFRPRLDTLTVNAGSLEVALRHMVATDSTLSATVENISNGSIDQLTLHLYQTQEDSAAGATIVPQQSVILNLAAGQQQTVTLPVNVNAIGPQPLWQAHLTVSAETPLCTLIASHRLEASYPTLTVSVNNPDNSHPRTIAHNRIYRLQGETTGDYDSLRISITLLPQGTTLSTSESTLTFSTPDSICHLWVSGTLFKDNWSHSESYSLLAGDRTEDFEEGMGSFPWSTTTVVPWQLDSAVSHSGRFSLRSGAISDRECSTLTLEAEFDAKDTISYWVKTSSDNNDKFVFYIDGNRRLPELWGEFDWHCYSFSVNAGKHTFTWSYRKSASGSSGSDCAWVDDIRLPNARWTGVYGTSCSQQEVGINDIAAPKQPTLYPNPATQQVTIHSDDAVTVLVHDAVGRLVTSFPLRGERLLDVSHWTAGLYIISATSGSHSTIDKLIISHP